MKLIELTIKNFRSLNGDVNISFENSDIIFLFGQNNFGKSSILTAYEYFVTPKQKALISDFFGFKEENKIEMIAVFQKDSGDDEIFAKKGFDKWVIPSNNRIKFRKSWTKIDEEGQKETWDPTKSKFELNGFGGLETHLTHEAPTPIRIPALPSIDELSKWIKDTVKKTVLKQLKVDEKEAYDKVLEDIVILQEKILNKDVISKLSTQANTNFQRVFPDLTLNVNSVVGNEFDLSKALEAEFSVTISDPRHPNINQGFNLHGHGVVRQTMFNFLGIVKNELPTETSTTSRKEFLLLFEEPEIYLHPKAILLLRKVLYDLCNKSQFQILCASHSPNLIDISKPHTSLVRVVRDSLGTTQLYQVGDNLFAASDDIKDKVQMINRFNPHVCETFFADEVILVEGDTEAIVCRELLNKLCPKRDIFVVNTGSKNNIPFFQRVFNHFRIKQHIIHDSDTRFVYEIKDKAGTLEYIPVLKKDTTQRINSAWSLNETIWSELEEGNKLIFNLSRRYVSIYNFEVSNNYVYDTEKGKPLSAYEYVKNIDAISNPKILEFISQITELIPYSCDYSQTYLETNVIEPK